MDVSGLLKNQRKIHDEILDFIGRFERKKVAVWGAGHQALAIIAMTKIAREIRYVVDSATFKQGKFTPASHMPIVAPDALHSDPVDAVIVMAASYSDEVASILRQKYGKIIKYLDIKGFRTGVRRKLGSMCDFMFRQIRKALKNKIVRFFLVSGLNTAFGYGFFLY